MTAHRALSLREAAPLLQVSVRSLYRRTSHLPEGYLDEGQQVRFTRIGNQIRVSAGDVERFVEQREAPDAS